MTAANKNGGPLWGGMFNKQNIGHISTRLASRGNSFSGNHVHGETAKKFQSLPGVLPSILLSCQFPPFISFHSPALNFDLMASADHTRDPW